MEVFPYTKTFFDHFPSPTSVCQDEKWALWVKKDLSGSFPSFALCFKRLILTKTDDHKFSVVVKIHDNLPHNFFVTLEKGGMFVGEVGDIVSNNKGCIIYKEENLNAVEVLRLLEWYFDEKEGLVRDLLLWFEFSYKKEHPKYDVESVEQRKMNKVHG